MKTYILVIFQVISTAVICLVQTIALLINLDLYVPVLEYVAVIGIGVVIVLWILLLFMTSCERHDLDIMEEVSLLYHSPK